jgi:large subunit ribosomal protein L21
MFAVIKTGGKQYKVSPQDILKIEKLNGETGDQIVFDQVLSLGHDGQTHIGAPLVEGATVVGEIVEQGRSRKIIIFKKRRRQNSRRKNGHRQHFTQVQITEILTDGKKPSGKTQNEAAKKAKTDNPAETAKSESKKEAAPEKKAATPSPKSTKGDEPKTEALFKAPDSQKDDLKKISGVGPVLEKKLNALGITTYQQIADLSAEDMQKVDDALNFKGRIERDNWVQQAKDLMKG